ncbi:MAG: CDP-alcohol phosphatidyltransferase family protein [Flavobacteriales bacterium]|nr:CDP-alcohol phosphatidyltransferase family protein [Flavobacteriales bacterium]
MLRLPKLPDLLTSANLCCGVASILLASQGQLTMACWLVFAGGFFDVLDGFAARATGGGTALGAQLDSLADLVTFGVAPALIIWFMVLMPLAEPMQFLSLMAMAFEGPVNVGGKLEDANEIFALTGITVLILVVASAWRLAKFNVDTRQTHGFLGLATPANGLFWASLPLAITGSGGLVAPFGGLLKSLLLLLLYSPYLMLISLILGVLMLSELQLPGLKFKHFGWQGNQVIYILLSIGILLIALFGMQAVPMLLLLYVLCPLWGKLFSASNA